MSPQLLPRHPLHPQVPRERLDPPDPQVPPVEREMLDPKDQLDLPERRDLSAEQEDQDPWVCPDQADQ